MATGKIKSEIHPGSLIVVDDKNAVTYRVALRIATHSFKHSHFMVCSIVMKNDVRRELHFMNYWDSVIERLYDDTILIEA